MEISSKLTVKFQNSGGETELVKIVKRTVLKLKNRGSTYGNATSSATRVLAKPPVVSIGKRKLHLSVMACNTP